MIQVEHIAKAFGPRQALHNINLHIETGELFGIVGPDGAGKTTLQRLLAGVLDPSTGRIVVNGWDSVRNAEQLKALLGYMPQRFGLYGDLTVQENMQFVAQLYGLFGTQRDARIAEINDFTQLERFADRPAALLSGGMKKKLALGCVLMHQPQLLLLDEPTTGVDPVARRHFWNLLSTLHRQGITTVVATPYMDEAERCNRLVLLFEGRVLAIGTPQDIKAMVPGKVCALHTDADRAATTVLMSQAYILDVQTYGDQLNLIVNPDTDHIETLIRDTLQAAGIGVRRLVATSVRMEEAFIYLVKQARQEAVT